MSLFVSKGGPVRSDRQDLLGWKAFPHPSSATFFSVQRDVPGSSKTQPTPQHHLHATPHIDQDSYSPPGKAPPERCNKCHTSSNTKTCGTRSVGASHPWPQQVAHTLSEINSLELLPRYGPRRASLIVLGFEKKLLSQPHSKSPVPSPESFDGFHIRAAIRITHPLGGLVREAPHAAARSNCSPRSTSNELSGLSLSLHLLDSARSFSSYRPRAHRS